MLDDPAPERDVPPEVRIPDRQHRLVADEREHAQDEDDADRPVIDVGRQPREARRGIGSSGSCARRRLDGRGVPRTRLRATVTRSRRRPAVARARRRIRQVEALAGLPHLARFHPELRGDLLVGHRRGVGGEVLELAFAEHRARPRRNVVRTRSRLHPVAAR
jgi:hypothetical protein